MTSPLWDSSFLKGRLNGLNFKNLCYFYITEWFSSVKYNVTGEYLVTGTDPDISKRGKKGTYKLYNVMLFL